MRATACLLSLVCVNPLVAQNGASERTAFHASLWPTVVPVAAGAIMWIAQDPGVPTDPLSAPDRSGPSLVMMGGFVLGPSFGYFAAGLDGRGWRGVGLRTGLTLLSFAPAFAVCGWDCGKSDAAYDLAWVIVATGTGLSAASAIYDIARVKHNVRQQRTRQSNEGARLSLVPTYRPGGRAFGVRVGIEF